MWIANSHAAVLREIEKGGPEGVAQLLTAKAGERWMTHFVRELAALIDLEIEVQTPFYVLQPVPLSAEFREALARLLLACAALGVPTTVLSPGAPRPPPRDKAHLLRFGFLTHGEAANHWHIKDSHIPERFYFNRSGYLGWLKISDEQMRFIDDSARKANIRAEALSSAVQGKYEQAQSADPLPQGGVFFPLQGREAIVAEHQRLDMLDALRIAAVAAGETQRPLVVKRHPLCRDEEVAKAIDEVAAVPFVHIVEAPIEQALANADVVLTGNSSVGFSAICAYKPVVTFAGSEYECCTISVATPEQLATALRRSDWPVDRDRYDRFLQVYYDELTIPMHDDDVWRRQVMQAIAELVRGIDGGELLAIAKAAAPA